MSSVPGALSGSGAVPQGPKSGLGLAGYQWNLPPHKWSMPVEPSLVADEVVNSTAYAIGSQHRYRRGRIYWYARVDSDYISSTKYNDGSKSQDPRYGFQFLWNPSEINTSVAMNMSITPSFADKFVDVAGAFPSGEYLTFTIRIDRTNDFAYIKNIPAAYKNTSYDALAKIYANKDYYLPQYSFDKGFSTTFEDKIKALQQLGTIADLEYLYTAINGPGWVNQATGRKSSDIGFLSPTLLRIDLGPLSYIGYVNSLSVTHSSFSKGMIPITTDVSIQFNLMATAGLATK
jgi:hypothetical protein